MRSAPSLSTQGKPVHSSPIHLIAPKTRKPLISERLRAFGGGLVNNSGTYGVTSSIPPAFSQSGIKGVAAFGALPLGNHRWFRCTLRSRQIPCHRVLGAHVVDHNLKQHGILAAEELKRLVKALVFLLILLVVGKDGDGVLAPLRVCPVQN